MGTKEKYQVVADEGALNIALLYTEGLVAVPVDSLWQAINRGAKLPGARLFDGREEACAFASQQGPAVVAFQGNIMWHWFDGKSWSPCGTPELSRAAMLDGYARWFGSVQRKYFGPA